jgi:predicted DNA binding CopG/RHH family protein
MANKSNVPSNEKAEAQWWPQQEDKIAAKLEQAAVKGTLVRGILPRRSAAIPPTTIRLARTDIERARQQAEQRGLKYQTYLKMLIHEALQKEEKRRVG